MRRGERKQNKRSQKGNLELWKLGSQSVSKSMRIARDEDGKHLLRMQILGFLQLTLSLGDESGLSIFTSFPGESDAH